MNNTDLKFKEEFDKVKENVSKLVVGNKYKYADLMETLGLPVKKGKGKTTQVDRVKQYIDWDSKTKIYNGVKESVEMPTVKKSTRSEYFDFVSCQFEMGLSDYIVKYPNERIITISHTSALELGGVVSDSYRYARCDVGKEYTSEYTGVPIDCIEAYSEKLRKDGLSIIESTLKQLDKQGVIVFNKAITFIVYKRDDNGKIIKHTTGDGVIKYDLMYYNASTREQVFLKECKNKVLKEMFPSEKISNRMFLVKSNNVFDIYERKVISMLRNEYGIVIDKFYNSYEIGILKDKVNKEFDTLHMLKNEILLKEKICKKMINSKDKRYRLAMIKECKAVEDYYNNVDSLNGVLVITDDIYHERVQKEIIRADKEGNIKRMQDEINIIRATKESSNKEFDREIAIREKAIKRTSEQLKQMS